MGRIFLLTSISLIALTSYSPAPLAADKTNAITLRGNEKSTYSRLVFDWDKSVASPKFSVSQNGNMLTVKLNTPGKWNIANVMGQHFGRIDDYKILSPDTLQITFSGKQNIRHFMMDNRFVIDFKGKTTAFEAKQPAEKIETSAGEEHPSASTQKEEQTTTEDKQIADIKEETKDNKNIIIDKEEKKEPTKEASKINTYTINLAAITSIPLAAFDYNGYFWVISSKADIRSIPQITGEGADKLNHFEKLPNSNLSIFRTKLPDNLSKQVEGGGLAWKITLTDNPNAYQQKPLSLIREETEDSHHKKSYSLLWPSHTITRVAHITSPETGEAIKLAFVESAHDLTGPSQIFVDVDFLPSYVGMAAIEKTDGLSFDKTHDGLKISSPHGLNITNPTTATAITKYQNAQKKNFGKKGMSRIFNFADWQMGTASDLQTNRNLIITELGDQNDQKKAETLIKLAKLYLSFNYAPEALGFLDLALSYVPQLDGSPEYIALHGAANALTGRKKDAYRDFSAAGLNDIGEVAYWKAFTLAELDDWQQAAKFLPRETEVLENYTDEIKFPMALTLAEVALREGNTDLAQKYLNLLKEHNGDLPLSYKSAKNYLNGELYRQEGNEEETKKIWHGLEEGKDNLYHAKARFALTMLEKDSKEITPDKAIDNLESLRYAWRGDDLEVAINYNLAKIYLEQKQPIKALTLMDIAHSLNPDSEQGKKIDADMHQVFLDIFTPPYVDSVSPADILAVYSEFSKLIPEGENGEKLGRQLAEKMADADLLPRAINLLQTQLKDKDLKGAQAADTAIRLATFENMNYEADNALRTLDKAEILLQGEPTEKILSRQEEIGLLRAKAYAQKNQYEDAIAALSLIAPTEESLRLKADISWKAKKWQEAADALEQLIQNHEISLNNPISDENADLILNWAVALYLADNRYVLANVRERYGDAMAASSKAQKFEVVTRPRQASLLSDRETINSIIDESNIFKNFMRSFKNGDENKSSTTIPYRKPEENTIKAPSVSLPKEFRNNPDIKADDILAD